jgi:hypothetical protein
MSPPYLDSKRIAALLPMSEAIAVMEQTFRLLPPDRRRASRLPPDCCRPSVLGGRPASAPLAWALVRLPPVRLPIPPRLPDYSGMLGMMP